jgi:hypothetical protein
MVNFYSRLERTFSRATGSRHRGAGVFIEQRLEIDGSRGIGPGRRRLTI